MDWEREEAKKNKEEEAKQRKRIRNWVIIGVSVLFVIILASLSLTRVMPGYAGVQYSLVSGMKDEVLREGLKVHPPWVKVYEYPTSTETVELRNPRKDEKREDNSLQVNTGDAKSVRVDVRYYYKMDEEKLAHIFKRFRRQDAEWVAENFIKSEILNATQNVTTKHSVLQIYSQNREEIATEIRETLKERLAKDGIILEQFTFSDVRPDKETANILQQIADAENQREVLIREEKNLKQQRNNIREEKANEQAAANEDQEIARTKADTKAIEITIEAEAQAEANRILAKSLDSNIVQYEWIKKWEGILPKVSSDGGGASIVNIPESVFTDKEEE